MPHDVSHTEADDDRILYNLIVIRNQQTKDSEEWQRLNYDIYTLRQIRREVRNRWRRILEDLGFQREADSLLSVTKLSTMSDSKNTRKAREMLLKLAEETSIFPASWDLSERYLLVVVSGCLSSWPRFVSFSVISGTPTSQPHQLHQDRVGNGDATVSTRDGWLQSHLDSFEEKDFQIPPKTVETRVVARLFFI
ncbi:melanoregulin isoform X3 [Alexandromys fortis]|nr:melanoregulin isoform X3 [Microtus fortis]